MKNSPFFSVIIPAYNRASFIPFTLDSIAEQTFSDFEVLIVDDGSTDNTSEIVTPYVADERFHYYRIINSERGAARNYGVQRSKGRYVTFLDSDDIFLPWHLETAYRKIGEKKSPAVFHLAYEILHPNGYVQSLSKLPSPVNQKLMEGNFLSCMGVFLQRPVAIDNPFDEDRALSGSEDYELWMRIAARMPILAFQDVTSRLINHDERSVVAVNPAKLTKRIELLQEKLEADQFFLKSFGDNKQKFASYCELYLSLHLAMSGKRLLALKRLIYAFCLHPYIMFKYRFIVVCKKIILW